MKYLFLVLLELLLTFSVFNVASAAECPVANQCVIADWNAVSGVSLYFYGIVPSNYRSNIVQCSYLLQNTTDTSSLTSATFDLEEIDQTSGVYTQTVQDVAALCANGGDDFVLVVSCSAQGTVSTSIAEYNISGTCT